MLTLIVGHQGVGKSAYLARQKAQAPHAAYIDLDAYIEKRWGLAPSEWIKTRGEADFRQMESATLRELTSRHNGHIEQYIALGAGFEGPIPPTARLLWLKRDSDNKGRFFGNRPLMVERLEQRTKRYKRWAHAQGQIYHMREGSHLFGDPAEAMFRSGQYRYPNSCYETLSEEYFSSLNIGLIEAAKAESARGLNFEYRSDLSSLHAFQDLRQSLGPAVNFLLSLRKEKWPLHADVDWRHFWQSYRGPVDFDVDFATTHLSRADSKFQYPQLGHLPWWVASLHTRSATENIRQMAERLSQQAEELASKLGPAKLLKLAPEINSFAELAQGHRWAAVDPSRRVFLPRASAAAQWKWYRLWTLAFSQAPLTFVRSLTEGLEPSQPTLSEVLSLQHHAAATPPSRPPGFAAILAEDASQSFSPLFHAQFFAKKQMPFLSVSTARENLSAEILDFLDSLGAHYLALSSPHKGAAYQLAKQRALSATQSGLALANTLSRDSGKQRRAWRADFSDPAGLQPLCSRLQLHAQSVAAAGPYRVMIWGAGAMGAMLKAQLPDADIYSVRSSSIVSANKSSFRGPYSAMIWAAGPDSSPPEQSFLSEKALVLDLNYSDSSKAKGWALNCGFDYYSGEEFFLAQAKRQQSIWSSL